jgi:hypothetical protein
MSWLYSQALVAAYLEANSSGGLPSAPLSGKPTPQAYLSPDRMKAFSRISRFGMTCEPLTDDLGADVLTWCLEASPVRTSAQPERAQESTESAAECGRTWRESFARWDRATSSWRTPQCSLLADLDVFSETWPRWGMMRAGECSEQSMPVLRTSETGSGLWLTPTCMNIAPTDGRRKSREAFRASIGRSDAPGGLAEQVATPKFWPTPDARDSQPEGLEAGRRRMEKYSTCGLQTAVKLYPTPTTEGIDGGSNSRKAAKARGMWPTPTCHNARDSDSPSEANRNTPSLCHQARGGDKTLPKFLNPMWVEWLMGWPLGWTDLKPLETDKFRQWLNSHGGF